MAAIGTTPTTPIPMEVAYGVTTTTPRLALSLGAAATTTGPAGNTTAPTRQATTARIQTLVAHGAPTPTPTRTEAASCRPIMVALAPSRRRLRRSSPRSGLRRQSRQRWRPKKTHAKRKRRQTRRPRLQGARRPRTGSAQRRPRSSSRKLRLQGTVPMPLLKRRLQMSRGRVMRKSMPTLLSGRAATSRTRSEVARGAAKRPLHRKRAKGSTTTPTRQPAAHGQEVALGGSERTRETATQRLSRLCQRATVAAYPPNKCQLGVHRPGAGALHASELEGHRTSKCLHFSRAMRMSRLHCDESVHAHTP
mmetsp:Transcript_583/g.1265  ORF Transcript_583/g.1265 Transcript_583/m.1265 type:complete len:307 (+) Transcript_583:227-1147(+)